MSVEVPLDDRPELKIDINLLLQQESSISNNLPGDASNDYASTSENSQDPSCTSNATDKAPLLDLDSLTPESAFLHYQSRSDDQACQVCNQPAVGFHHRAYVCEACKKFFMRHATNRLKQIQQDSRSVALLKQPTNPYEYFDLSTTLTNCPLGGGCRVVGLGRGKCPHCRYKKCLDLGMSLTPPGGEATCNIAKIPCRVCGGASSGFHFGAITCEGCKGFFRRTIMSNLKLECAGVGKCPITPSNRNICKSCRLDRCLQVGMSKDGSRIGRQPNAIKFYCAKEILQNSQQQQQQHQSQSSEIDQVSEALPDHEKKKTDPVSLVLPQLTVNSSASSFKPFEEVKAAAAAAASSQIATDPIIDQTSGGLFSFRSRKRLLPNQQSIRMGNSTLENMDLDNLDLHNHHHHSHHHHHHQPSQHQQQPHQQQQQQQASGSSNRSSSSSPEELLLVRSDSVESLNQSDSGSSFKSVLNSIDELVLITKPYEENWHSKKLRLNGVAPAPGGPPPEDISALSSSSRLSSAMMFASQAVMAAAATLPEYDAFNGHHQQHQQLNHHHQPQHSMTASNGHFMDDFRTIGRRASDLPSFLNTAITRGPDTPANFDLSPLDYTAGPIPRGLDHQDLLLRFPGPAKRPMQHESHLAGAEPGYGLPAQQQQQSASLLPSPSAGLQQQRPSWFNELSYNAVSVALMACQAHETIQTQDRMANNSMMHLPQQTQTQQSQQQHAPLAPQHLPVHQNAGSYYAAGAGVAATSPGVLRAMITFPNNNMDQPMLILPRRDMNTLISIDKFMHSMEVASEFLTVARKKNSQFLRERCSKEPMYLNDGVERVWSRMMFHFDRHSNLILDFLKLIPGFPDLPSEDKRQLVRESMYPVILLEFSEDYSQQQDNASAPTYNYFDFSSDERDIILRYFPTFKRIAHHLIATGRKLQQLQMDRMELMLLCTLEVFRIDPNTQRIKEFNTCQTIFNFARKALILHVKKNYADANTRLEMLSHITPILQRFNLEHHDVIQKLRYEKPNLNFPEFFTDMFI